MKKIFDIVKINSGGVSNSKMITALNQYIEKGYTLVSITPFPTNTSYDIYYLVKFEDADTKSFEPKYFDGSWQTPFG